MTESFKEFERKAWESKAPRYQSTWGEVTRQPIATILDRAGAGPGCRLLDCGCGPGELVHAAALRGADALGADHSSVMVQIASANFPQCRFQQEDAERLSFAAGSFDAVVLNYLLLHVADQERTLLEAGRVLKSGGRLVCTVWLPPSQSPGLSLMFEAVKKYADTTVIPPAQDIFMFSDPLKAGGFLEQNGFTRVTFEEFPTCWLVANADTFFTAVQAGTRIGGMIDLQRPDVKERIRQEILTGVERFRTAGGYRILMPSGIISAVRA